MNENVKYLDLTEPSDCYKPSTLDYCTSIENNSSWFTSVCGNSGNAARYGEFSVSSGCFNKSGDAQVCNLIARCITNGVKTEEMFLDGKSERIIIPDNSTATYSILVSGRSLDRHNSFGAKIEGILDNRFGNLELFPNINTIFGPNSSGTFDFVSSITRTITKNVLVTANNINKSLSIYACGNQDETIQWVASITLIQNIDARPISK